MGGRRNPHVQGGLATPPPQLEDDEPDESAEPDAVDDEPDEGDDEPPADDDESPSGGGSASSRSRGWSMPKVKGGGATQTGAGYVLGLIVWGWVILPFMQKGPKGVKAVLMAKFLNKAPDGSALP